MVAKTDTARAMEASQVMNLLNGINVEIQLLHKSVSSGFESKELEKKNTISNVEVDYLSSGTYERNRRLYF